jgi:hypothetical protein
MAELTVPQIDFSILGNLGTDYRKGRAEAARAQTLAELGQGTGPLDYNEASRKLLAAGDREGALSLATLGQTVAERQSNRDWQRQEAARSQANSDRSFGLQERAAARADEGPVETAAQRAAAARANGVDPTTPAGKSYILTGKLPEADTNFSNTIDQRKTAALANGLDPSSPGFQSFVLTGKMPREDAQPLTATDKKAILEADEHIATNQTTIENLKKAKQLSKVAMSGPGSKQIGYATSLIGSEAGTATTDLNNLVTSNALTQLKSIFGGNPTEGERSILLDIQGSATQPDAVRQKIYDRAIEAANKRLQFNKQRADELRGGQFYKPAGSPSRAPIKQTQGITQQDYEALPSGSTFTAPDGTQRVKP